jgi:hypothetical protein
MTDKKKQAREQEKFTKAQNEASGICYLFLLFSAQESKSTGTLQ